MKMVSFQELFDELPLSMIEGEAPLEQSFAEDVKERVWKSVKRSCRIQQKGAVVKVRTWRRMWLIPAVAILLVAAAISCMALTTHLFVPSFWFSRSVDRDALVSEYDGMVKVGKTAVSDGLCVSLDGFVLDGEKDTLTVSVSVTSTDHIPLSELTTERVSWIPMMSFRRVTLYRDDVPVVLTRTAVGEGFHRGGNGMISRTDDVSDPYKATFQITYDAIGADKDLSGESCRLEFCDLTDVVELRDDIGFCFASLAQVYDTLGKADADRLVASGQTDDGARCRLIAGTSSVAFSTRFENVRIDGIAPFVDDEQGEEFLYVSYCAESIDDDTAQMLDDLTLVDMRENRVVGGTVTYRDEERMTLCYRGVTVDDLIHMFMMRSKGEETVVRASGMWTVTFDIGEKDSLTEDTLPIDEIFTYGAYTLHATSLALSDHSLYIEGSVTVDPTLDDHNVLCDYHTSLTLADGTTIHDVLWQGGFNDELSDGDFCFGGDLVRFVDHTRVKAVTLFGKTVELKWE